MRSRLGLAQMLTIPMAFAGLLLVVGCDKPAATTGGKKSTAQAVAADDLPPGPDALPAGSTQPHKGQPETTQPVTPSSPSTGSSPSSPRPASA